MYSNVNKFCIFVDFKINQARIAKELCENKDKPVMKCNGKCYLAKQMKKEEEKENKQLPPLQKEKVEIIYFNHTFATVNPTIVYSEEDAKANYPIYNRTSKEYIEDVFKPPRA